MGGGRGEDRGRFVHAGVLMGRLAGESGANKFAPTAYQNICSVRKRRRPRYGQGVPRDVARRPAPTAQDLAVLDALRELRDRGERPTIRRLASHLGGRSPATVQRHLAALRSQGLIVPTASGLDAADRHPEATTPVIPLIPLLTFPPPRAATPASTTAPADLLEGGERVVAVLLTTSIPAFALVAGDVLYVLPEQPPKVGDLAVTMTAGNLMVTAIRRVAASAKTRRATEPGKGPVAHEGRVVAMLHRLGRQKEPGKRPGGE
jgi:SOS-response transcriptional repressor LexA